VILLRSVFGVYCSDAEPLKHTDLFFKINRASERFGKNTIQEKRHVLDDLTLAICSMDRYMYASPLYSKIYGTRALEF